MKSIRGEIPWLSDLCRSDARKRDRDTCARERIHRDPKSMGTPVRNAVDAWRSVTGAVSSSAAAATSRASLMRFSTSAPGMKKRLRLHTWIENGTTRHSMRKK